MDNKKALVLFSGGVDSTTALAMAVKKYGADKTAALSISYGQKHSKEIEAARKIADYYGTELLELDLSKMFEYSSIALSLEAEIIYYGAHSDDAAGSAYPDCSKVFNDAMNTAIYEGSGHKIKILAPFVEWNKKQVVAEGVKLGVPYEMTWSCYEGGDEPCGECGTCRDRREAFLANGLDIK